MQPVIRVILVHAEDRVEVTLNRLVGRSDDIEYAFRARSFEELLASQRGAADLTLLDVDTASASKVANQIRVLRTKGMRVIAMSTQNLPRDVLTAMAAGANASLKNSVSASRLGDEIRHAINLARLVDEA